MSSFFSDEKRERVARRLFNDARVAEDAKQDWVAARKYKLLEEPRFRDTKVFTEVKDRAERLRHQQVMEGYQQALAKQLQGLQTALVSEIRSSKIEIIAAIGEHNRRIEAAMSAQASAYRDYVDSQVGAISSAISYQRDAMESAMRQASAQNEYLFSRAQESAREEAAHNRKCVELLAKRGSKGYGWLSGCT